MSVDPYTLLPSDLLSKASLCGNEYAWPVADIPAVINAAESVNLLNVGGQLQFRLPDGSICECWWIEVGALSALPNGLDWQQQVRFAAETARQKFDELQQECDFEAEGRSGFPKFLPEFEAGGGSLADAKCFVWYLDSEETYSNSTMT